MVQVIGKYKIKNNLINLILISHRCMIILFDITSYISKAEIKIK